ncbi:MAG: dienelactone hydrolase family protein [Alphaproteobacteria bacterium]|jgi:carboxymethylenebutenolidase
MPEITINAVDGGKFSAYLALPQKAPAPAIILVQEIFGVNDVMRTLADGFAAQGFITLCPDLFWRLKPGIQISDKTEVEMELAFDLYRDFDVPKGLLDIKATLDHIRRSEECTGKVGCVGYCLGGSLTYFVSTGTNIDVAVGYYGIGIEDGLGQATNITRPLMLHIAGNDDFVSPEAQALIKAELGKNDLVTLHSYPGAAHAFARLGGTTYNPETAATANQRTLAFLKDNLD